MNHLTRLRLIPGLIFFLGFAVTIGVAAGLLDTGERTGFAAWSVAAAAITLSVFVRNAGRNHTPGSSRLYRGLGLANSITLVRGLILSALAGMIAVSPSASTAWVATGMYTGAIILDFFDGFAARRTNRITELGSVMDVEYDSLGVLIASILVVRFGVAGFWFLLVGAARYLFVFGVYVRTKTDRPVVPLQGSLSGRVAAGLQMGYMSAALWPIIPVGYRSTAAVIFSMFFFASFARDWLVTSAALDKRGPEYLRTERLLRRLIPILQIALRIAVVVVFALSIVRFDLLWAVVGGVLSAAVLAGVAGRGAALALLLVWIFALPGTAIGMIDHLLEALCLLVLILGTGPFSIVAPEEAVFRR